MVGGESGPGAWPSNIQRIRLIVQQCRGAGVPVFVKQLGSDVLTPHSIGHVRADAIAREHAHRRALAGRGLQRSQPAGEFVPRMVTATHRLQAGRAGRKLFLSDMATWITDAVASDLPGWHHIADYWHACQHAFPVGEALYGKDGERAKQWSRYWCRRLRSCGAGVVEDRLCSLALYYSDLTHQRAVLDLAAFFRRHAHRMDYPAYERQGWTISSGPMESFCKQIGQRMKGSGMRWSMGNVSPMASLVSRWSLEGERSPLFGAVPSAN